MFARFGLPKIIVCDNGRQFTDANLKAWLSENYVKISHPYWPQANGEVERQNQSILKRLKIAYAEMKNWNEELLKLLMMYRSTPHTTTGVSPADVSSQTKDKTTRYKYKSKVVEEVREQDAWKKLKRKEYYDKVHHAKGNKIKQGDRVLVREPKKNKLSTNFGAKEFIVTERKGNIITIQSEEGKRYKRNLTEVRKIIDPDEEEEEEIKHGQDLTEEIEEESNIAERKGDTDTREEDPETESASTSERPKRNRRMSERYGVYRVHGLDIKE